VGDVPARTNAHVQQGPPDGPVFGHVQLILLPLVLLIFSWRGDDDLQSMD
jgi:hypothetical protein